MLFLITSQIDLDINLGDAEFLDVWDDAYTAVMRYSRAWDGFWVNTLVLTTIYCLIYSAVSER
jgi:hypothetical protein